MIAQIVTWCILAYGAIGLVFGVAFAVRGAGVIDPVAKRATLGFRVLILPGAAGLWPWLALRWVGVRKARR